MRRAVAVVAVLALVLGACGGDDDGGGAATAEGDGGGAGEDEYEAVCAVANEIFEQDDFPSAEQVQRYEEVAPPELAGAVTQAAPPFVEHEGDPVALFAAFADDEVEAAIAQINAFEAEHCGIPRDDTEAPPQEAEPGAAAVGVTAREYEFELEGDVAPGLTSFVLTNEGAEAHFLGIFKLADGHSVDEAIEYEGDAVEAGIVEEDFGESGFAAPGGNDEEFLTIDLEPGNYGMYCFLPTADGTPHAFKGMATPFTVG